MWGVCLIFQVGGKGWLPLYSVGRHPQSWGPGSCARLGGRGRRVRLVPADGRPQRPTGSGFPFGVAKWGVSPTWWPKGRVKPVPQGERMEAAPEHGPTCYGAHLRAAHPGEGAAGAVNPENPPPHALGQEAWARPNFAQSPAAPSTWRRTASRDVPSLQAFGSEVPTPRPPPGRAGGREARGGGCPWRDALPLRRVLGRVPPEEVLASGRSRELACGERGRRGEKCGLPCLRAACQCGQVPP